MSESDAKSTEPVGDTTSTEDAGDATSTDDARLLDADGRYRPRFVLDFPSHPELDALVAAFERGDFQTVNAGAASLRDKSDDPVIKAACEELLSRIRPDPLMKALLGISVLLFAALVAWSYFRNS